MAGTIKQMIDIIVTERSRGNPTLIATTRTKLMLKGFNPDRFTGATEDDPQAINKLKDIAREMGVSFDPSDAAPNNPIPNIDHP